jgi:MFS family permease
MWELYALWAWVGVAAAASYSTQMAMDEANSLAKLTAFIAIGSGAFLCPLAGIYADRIGKARITIIAMFISGSTAIATALAFGGPAPLVFCLFVIWGLAVIPDSAQFSALIADIAPANKAGSLMTLQTALGFLLTMITVQLTPLLASLFGWPIVLAALALGPMAGILAMRPLQQPVS